MEADSSNGPIFIVGCPRSGTTMLRDALRAHSRLTFPRESHFIPLLYQAYGDPRNDREAVQLAARIRRLHWVRSWNMPIDPRDYKGLRTYRAVIEQLFGAWARRENKQRWGEKTPLYVDKMATLAEIFPDARFVHIIRDGRDVALSWIRKRFGPGNVYMAAIRWRDAVRAGQTSGKQLGPGRYLELGYEQLTRNPRPDLERICEFIGEPFEESMLELDRMGRGQFAGVINPVAATSLELDRSIGRNSGKWKKAMSKADRVVFESVAGDLLAELGYEREGETRAIASSERLKWRLHQSVFWWWQRLLSRHPLQLAETELIMRRARLQVFLKRKLPGLMGDRVQNRVDA